jgi:hypothetical protein
LARLRLGGRFVRAGLLFQLCALRRETFAHFLIYFCRIECRGLR